MKRMFFKVNTESILKLVKEYITITNPYIKTLSEKKLNKFQYFYFCLLLRFNINFKALIPLFTSFKADKSFKLPISLILRSLIDDYLTVQYLLTFYDPADKKNIALINEITIIDRDFVKFQEDLLREELNQLKNEGIAEWDSDKKIQARIDQFKKDNPEFFTSKLEGYKLKSIEFFRKTTPSAFFQDVKDRKKPLTDRNKYERLKSLSLNHFAIQAYMPFKYFSQFQHPSSNMDRMMMSDPNLVDTRFYLMTIESILVATNQILSITLESKEAVPKLKLLQDEIIKLIKNAPHLTNP